ncbi:MAG: hypothetical protein KatS3mg095_0643 [Candidatus Parcubacteria bacterium]|nr:MAG: hypothetical protein KatS3mg095_0643 [Candidatus Parcubacteria bacterium]
MDTLTYSKLKIIIDSIKEYVESGQYSKAVQEVNNLKNMFINFFEEFSNILEKIENRKISIEEYKNLFQIVSELYLDLDSLYVDVTEYTDDYLPQAKLSKLSILLKILGLTNEIKWFDLANDIMGNVYDFIEYHYEGQNAKFKYCLSIEEIKDRIKLLKAF